MAAKKRKGRAEAGWGPWPWLLALALGGTILLIVWQNSRAPAATGLGVVPPDAPGEVFPSEGTQHVAPPQRVTYGTDPPTSGPHYGEWTQPGFYGQAENPQLPEYLVHALEHGNIVAYYDPQRATPETIAYLREQARRYRGTWDGFIAVPRPDPEHEVILTAWTRMLRMQTLDTALADRFIDAYRGRGPENPVR